MKKLFFILLLLFPAVLFGQTVTGLKADTIKLNGKVKIYTLPTIADTTGYDLIGWSRNDSSLKLIPSTLIGNSCFVLTTNTTQAGNVGSGEDDLLTYSVPAGKLATDGDFIEFSMTFQTAVNPNSKTIVVYFGSTDLITLPSLSSAGGYITITGKIIRTGATSQHVEISYVSTNDAQTAVVLTTSETLSGALTLKATGEGVSDDDIIQRSMIVKFFSN